MGNVHEVQGAKIITSTKIVLNIIDAFGLVQWYKTEY